MTRVSNCCLIIFVISGCASGNLEKKTDQEINPEVSRDPQDYVRQALLDRWPQDSNGEALIFGDSGRYPIICNYYHPGRDDYGQGLTFFDTAWVYAKEDGYQNLLAQGVVEDGFVVADRFVGWNSLWKDKKLNINSQDQLENICQNSIDKKYPNKNLKFYNYSVLKSFTVHKRFPLVIAASEKDKNFISRMVIFGDSLSDNGGTYGLKSTIKVMPERPYFKGAFANGPAHGDIMSRQANIVVKNMAKGGATSGPIKNFDLKDIINTVKNTGRGLITGNTYNVVKNYIKQDLNNGKLSKTNKTLFLVWTGANDYLSRADSAKTMNKMLLFDGDNNCDFDFINSSNFFSQIEEFKTSMGSGTACEIVKFSVSNISSIIINLHKAGARNFLIGFLPDVGKTPSIIEDKNYQPENLGGNEAQRIYDLSQKFTKIVLAHNKFLNRAVEIISRTYLDSEFLIFDSFKALGKIMDGTGPNGETNFDWGIDMSASFQNIDAAGKAGIKLGKKCFQGSYLGSKNSSLICDNPRQMLYWDSVHPSAKGHCGIAYLIHKSIYDAGLLGDTKPNFSSYMKTCSQ